jgi:hypothetical protein
MAWTITSRTAKAGEWEQKFSACNERELRHWLNSLRQARVEEWRFLLLRANLLGATCLSGTWALQIDASTFVIFWVVWSLIDFWERWFSLERLRRERLYVEHRLKQISV